MGLYEVPLSVSLLGFGMGTMLVLRAVFNMLMRNASPRGPMCFRWLMFSLLGHCELLFLPFYCLLDLSCGECDVISLCLLMDLFVLCVACLAVFDESVRNMFGCVCYFVVESYGSV